MAATRASLSRQDGRLKLGVVNTERRDQLRHARVAALLSEGLRGLDQNKGEPEKDHASAVPPSDVVRRCADADVVESNGFVVDRMRARRSGRSKRITVSVSSLPRETKPPPMGACVGAEPSVGAGRLQQLLQVRSPRSSTMSAVS